LRVAAIKSGMRGRDQGECRRHLHLHGNGHDLALDPPSVRHLRETQVVEGLQVQGLAFTRRIPGIVATAYAVLKRRQVLPIVNV
jgi:hypothetical protein